MLSADEFALLRQAISINKIKTTVISDSMLPLIKPDQQIEVEQVDDPETSLKKFDILVIYQNQKLICHYLHHINQNLNNSKKFITRSLTYGHEDLPVSADQILGRVTKIHLPFWLKLKLSLVS